MIKHLQSGIQEKKELECLEKNSVSPRTHEFWSLNTIAD